MPVGESQNGRLTPTKKIDSINDQKRHREYHPLMPGHNGASVQSKEQLAARQVAWFPIKIAALVLGARRFLGSNFLAI
jgi:hypothetical protein